MFNISVIGFINFERLIMSSGYSLTAITFKRPETGASSRRKNNKPNLVMDREAFNKAKNMSDTDILMHSLKYAEDKSKKTVAGKLLGALPLLFSAAVPALFGAMQKGSLSTKLASAAITAAIFGGGSVICDKTDNVLDRIKAKSPKIKEASDKHPLVTLVGNIALKSALITAAIFGATKGISLAQKHFTPSFNSVSKAFNSLSKRIDSSRAGNTVSKMSKNFQEFSNRHPKLSGFASKHSYLAPVALLFGWMGFSDVVSKKVEDNQVKFASKRAEDLLSFRNAARQIDFIRGIEE